MLLAVLVARPLFGREGMVVVLVTASLGFYGHWDWRFLPLLLASILGNHLMGKLLARPYGERTRRSLLILGIAANLGAPDFFK